MKALILSSLATAALAVSPQVPFSAPAAPQRQAATTFTLQHAVHLSTSNRTLPPLHRKFTPQDHLDILDSSSHPTTHSLRSTLTTAYRPNNQRAFQAARRAAYASKAAIRGGRLLSVAEVEDELWGSTLEWDEAPIEMPDVTDFATLGSLAKITANAYATAPGDSNWYDLEGKWNVSDSFGWLEDGIRGHVFADATNSTIIVAIKGTSTGLIGGGGPTTHNDKTNDNLLFSCCCARVDWSWSTVCDCYSGAYQCQQDCVEEAVMTKSAYYPVATDLYNNITALYPHAQIWLTGHSLGGSLASLLSLTYGVPSVSFEAVSDRLAASRLHLPTPPGLSYSHSNITTHVFHNADPIPMGVCTGVASSCAVAGYALETRCHSGRSIVYDTVGLLGWSVDIRTHRIASIIENLFVEDWGVPKKIAATTRKGLRGWGWWPGGGGGKEEPEEPEDPNKGGQHGGRGVPDALPEVDCVDCFKWEYMD
ncbi:triacylglycerol lipase ATG15-like protein [Pseudohyphozyma bogoriensis]|nr:triacylglycerol lipase ATG15-like protein [Pseudohyphozyma bogoriensis]